MATQTTPLYVRLSSEPAHRLEQAVSQSGKSKRQIVEDAVREHLTDEGLVVGRVTLREDAYREVLTLDEAASLLRLDETDLRKAAEAGTVPGRLIADTWRFSRAALLAWLGEHFEGTTQSRFFK